MANSYLSVLLLTVAIQKHAGKKLSDRNFILETEIVAEMSFLIERWIIREPKLNLEIIVRRRRVEETNKRVWRRGNLWSNIFNILHPYGLFYNIQVMWS